MWLVTAHHWRNPPLRHRAVCHQGKSHSTNKQHGPLPLSVSASRKDDLQVDLKPTTSTLELYAGSGPKTQAVREPCEEEEEEEEEEEKKKKKKKKKQKKQK